eukprot:COSAG06_NODE_83536_length_101_cov_27.000000_1_plen_33_part_11
MHLHRKLRWQSPVLRRLVMTLEQLMRPRLLVGW